MDETDDALQAVEAWAREIDDDFTDAVGPDYIEGFRDAKRVALGLIQAHSDPAIVGLLETNTGLVDEDNAHPEGKTWGDVLQSLPHGAEVVMLCGDVLTMNRDYPRPAFDVVDGRGEYQGHLYPHNVPAEYARDD